jgi:hypothetical protein
MFLVFVLLCGEDFFGHVIREAGRMVVFTNSVIKAVVLVGNLGISRGGD